MSIFAFGGEMGFFTPSDANAIEATAGLASGTSYNSSFARCYTSAKGSSSYDDTPAISAQADFWLHVDIDQNSTVANSSTQATLIELLDSGGVAQVRLTSSYGSGSTWQMWRWNGSAWLSVGSCTAEAIALQTIDIHVVSNTASGSINFYMSSTNRINSGTVDLSGFTGVAKVRCWGVTRGTSSKIAYSQMILANESTIGLRVGTIAMTGQGTTHTFTNGGFANIDEAVYSDADEINSGTASQIEMFTGTPVPNFTGYTVRAVAVCARAKTSGGAPTKMRLMLRSSGTDYDSGSDITLDAAYGAFCHVWETDPATSAAWANTAISSLQYGVKSIT